MINSSIIDEKYMHSWPFLAINFLFWLGKGPKKWKIPKTLKIPLWGLTPPPLKMEKSKVIFFSETRLFLAFL